MAAEASAPLVVSEKSQFFLLCTIEHSRRAWLFSDTPEGAEASCGIYSIVTTARANGLMPMRYLEWLLDELPNAPRIEDASVLERLIPWSPGVPASCRMTPAEAAKPDPMAEPLVDVDPNALDEK